MVRILKGSKRKMGKKIVDVIAFSAKARRFVRNIFHNFTVFPR